MVSTRVVVCLACAFLAGVSAAYGQTAPSTDSDLSANDDLTVTGARRERRESPQTGSRISRAEPAVRFQSVATTTGVAGLTPGSGMDPFAGGTRTVTEVECRSDNPRLSPAAACRLVPVQRLLAAGSYGEALAALDRFVSAAGITDEERYIAAGLQYRIAVAMGDSPMREEALRAMLATSATPSPQRLAALRTLVSMAVQRGDDEAAVVLLQQLLAIAPEDTRSLVNLASLRAEAGRHDEAAALVRQAITIARRRGETVPDEWLSFASSQPGR